uniref:Neurotransmitter-gated ion-channel transmembrane domain-containing protein n=1 Tax=Branchiostoma floridae TaxID=7739 RepID=C3ZNI3_BRAFL|eukprot:XP_002589925.1 hypothetical protein BRAFLDRAFT_81947 [Branchiostoma floridae]
MVLYLGDYVMPAWAADPTGSDPQVNIRSRLEEEMLVVYSPNQAPEIETKTENHNRPAISFNGSVVQIVDLVPASRISHREGGYRRRWRGWPDRKDSRLAWADHSGRPCRRRRGECRRRAPGCCLRDNPPAVRTAYPPTRLEAAVSSGFTELIRVIEEQVVKNKPEVSDYALLAKVLDRLCLVLYVASVTLAVPMTMYLGK